MNIPYVMKKCTKCGRWLVANEANFHKQKTGKYGLFSICKECRSKYNKRYNNQYRKNNREKELERKRRYREANKEKERERKRRWCQSTQGQVLEFNRRNRRRIKEEQQGSGITKDQWLECMSFFDFKCAYSGEVLSKKTRSIDHIVPLNSGGEHEIWNLVPMTRSLNSSKHDKDMLEWYRKQDFYDSNRLAKIYEWQEYARKKWKIS